MENNSKYYFEALYPLQDRVLRLVKDAETGFYLTGGTALSRGYLNHRFSDDLDFFVNDENDFRLWSEQVIRRLNRPNGWALNVILREARIVRLEIVQAEVNLKIEMINDVPAHAGTIAEHPVLGMLDTPENILANKLTAIIGREEPKDLADIWGLACKKQLSLAEAIQNSQSKAAGIFPADLARVLCSARREDWESIKWIEAPAPEVYIRELAGLGEKLIAK